MPSEQEIFLKTLYQQNYPKMMEYAGIILKKDSLWAEEIVLDTFFAANKKYEMLRQRPNQDSFLLNLLKKKIHVCMQARQLYLKPFLLPGRAGGGADVMEAARKALSEEELRMFQRFVFDGASHLEIAKEREISVWMCKDQLRDIRKRVLEHMGRRAQSGRS